MSAGLDNITPEWSHTFEADEVADEAVCLSISPDEDVMPALCRRLGVGGFESLSADLTLARVQGNMTIHVKGHIRARVEQECVVSLDPVFTEIDETFEAWFADPDQAVTLVKAKRERLTKSGAGEVPLLEESDDPEAIIDGVIDLGDLVTQHLSLVIDPYPHGEGVEYEYGDDNPRKVPEGFKDNPFAALKNWKQKLED